MGLPWSISYPQLWINMYRYWSKSAYSFDGQFHRSRVGYLADFLREILQLHFRDELQSEILRRFVEIAVDHFFDPFPVSRPHCWVLQICDERKGASELVHFHSEIFLLKREINRCISSAIINKSYRIKDWQYTIKFVLSESVFYLKKRRYRILLKIIKKIPTHLKNKCDYPKIQKSS